MRGVRCQVHGHLAGHHLALLPRRDQVTHRLCRPTNHGGLRRGHNRDHDIGDAAGRQFLAHLVGGQLHRCHRAGTRDAGAQAGAAANNAYPVFQRQRSSHDRGSHFAQRMADDRTRTDPVRLHRCGQRDLHGEQGGLHPVDTGHGLRCHHRLGHREPGLAGNQGLDHPDGRRRTPVRWRAGQRPSPPIASPGPRKSTPAPGHPDPPPPNRGFERRQSRVVRRPGPRGSPRSLLCARGGVHAVASTCTPGLRRGNSRSLVILLHVLLHPLGQSARRPAQLVGRGGR